MALIWSGRAKNGVRCNVYDDCIPAPGSAEERRIGEEASRVAYGILVSVAKEKEFYHEQKEEPGRKAAEDRKQIHRHAPREEDLVEGAFGDARSAHAECAGRCVPAD